MAVISIDAAELSDASLAHKLENLAGITNDDILSDPEIDRGRAILTQAEQELLQLLKRVEKLRVALAPHKRVPSDILLRIFEILCQETLPQDQGDREDELRRVPVALILSQVCALWRSMCHSNTDLWGTVAFRIEDDSEASVIIEETQILPEPTRIYLRASESVTLSGLDKVLRRVDILDLTPPSDDAFWNYHPSSISPMSLLSRLTILKIRRSFFEEPWEMPPGEFTSSLTLFGTAPQLKDFTLEYTSPLLLLTPDFPWNHITNLSLHLMPWSYSDSYMQRVWKKLVELRPFRKSSQLRSLTIGLPDKVLPLFFSLDIPWHKITRFSVDCHTEADYFAVAHVIPRCTSLSQFYLRPPKVASTSPLTFSSSIECFTLKEKIHEPILRSHNLWNNLLVLNLHALFIRPTMFIEILSQCRCIFDVSCGLCTEDREEEIAPQMILFLSRLHSLALQPIHNPSVLSLLHAPALKTLALDLAEHMDYSHIADLITRSACQLETFVIEQANIPGFGLFDKMLPGTRELLLALRYCINFQAPTVAFSNDVLQEIAKGTLLPVIRSLALGVENFESYYSLVISCLSRLESNQILRLQRIRGRTGGHVSMRMITKLRRLEKMYGLPEGALEFSAPSYWDP
ncbi:hypothetical protein H0H93_003194 [Arthromyces matolae]|nr:hypothetical protein H0H93_003194 [Arthromyces matolae]